MTYRQQLVVRGVSWHRMHRKEQRKKHKTNNNSCDAFPALKCSNIISTHSCLLYSLIMCFQSVNSYMGSIFLCLRRSCFDDPAEEDGEDDAAYDPPRPPEVGPNRMFRSSRVGVENDAVDSEDGEDCNCHPGATQGSEEPSGLRRFWAKLSDWGNPGYEPLEGRRRSRSALHATGEEKQKSAEEMAVDVACILGASPHLRPASEFEESRGIPSIANEEVVVPGSDLQKMMARAMSQNLEEQGDECVICMEGFDPTNPRMPTLCGCGENKTYFHLPCRYQWIEQSRKCPSCRKRLRWEEF